MFWDLFLIFCFLDQIKKQNKKKMMGDAIKNIYHKSKKKTTEKKIQKTYSLGIFLFFSRRKMEPFPHWKPPFPLGNDPDRPGVKQKFCNNELYK